MKDPVSLTFTFDGKGDSAPVIYKAYVEFLVAVIGEPMARKLAARMNAELERGKANPTSSKHRTITIRERSRS
jgi:hypothetical protein